MTRGENKCTSKGKQKQLQVSIVVIVVLYSCSCELYNVGLGGLLFDTPPSSHVALLACRLLARKIPCFGKRQADYGVPILFPRTTVYTQGLRPALCSVALSGLL